MTNFDVPELFGSPRMSPVESSVRPDGREPEFTEKLIGATPPVVAMVWK